MLLSYPSNGYLKLVRIKGSREHTQHRKKSCGFVEISLMNLRSVQAPLPIYLANVVVIIVTGASHCWHSHDCMSARVKWHLEMYHQILWWVYYYWHYYNCCLLCIPFYIFIFILYSCTIFFVSSSLPPATVLRLVSFVWIKWSENGLMCCSWAWVSFELRSEAMAASNE